MLQTKLRWFRHVERKPVDSVVRKADHMDDRRRPRETIKKYLEINELDGYVIYDSILCCRLIHVASLT